MCYNSTALLDMNITGYSLHNQIPLEITVVDRRVTAIREIDGTSANIFISPALVDIQVNGFCGYDLNVDTVTVEDVCEMVRKLWGVGTGFLCPTIVTASFESIRNSLEAVVKAYQSDPLIAHSILGIHLEGPYISSEDGPRGAHPLAYVRNPDWDEFRRLQDIADGMIRLVTLAPEKEGAIPFIEKLVSTGVVVSIGHTDATEKEIHEAVNAGATLSTHLGNGAHAMIQRHPNYIWEQLAADELYASLIVDGHHLPPSVVKSMLRAKTLDKCILISDATALAGMPPGTYKFAGQPVALKADHSIRLIGTEYLAGSAVVLLRCVENSVRFANISLGQALSLATVNPMRLLDIDLKIDRQNTDFEMDLIIFEWDPHTCKMDLKMTILSGEVVFDKSSNDRI